MAPRSVGVRGVSARVLSQRELGRATLARQLLLERATMQPSALLEHLVGLQAQEAASWYTGFWSRLEDTSQHSDPPPRPMQARGQA